MKFVMHRTFSIFQWEALVLLVAGVTVNQLNYCGKQGASGDVFSLAAVLYTVGEHSGGSSCCAGGGRCSQRL